jgi:hypothetical protein
MAPLASSGLRPTNRAPVFVFCAWMAMHAPRVLESFHVVLESFQKLHWFWKVAMWCFEKFSKATLVLESCYVVFWKVFKSSIAACLNTGFVFCFRRW